MTNQSGPRPILGEKMLIQTKEKILTIRDAPPERDAFDYLLKAAVLVLFWDGSLFSKAEDLTNVGA